MSIDPQEPGATPAGEPESTVNRDILDALTTLVKRAGTVGHSIAAAFGVTPPDLYALFKLDGSVAMKELAQRMGCDASFVTAIADSLEEHGFARREPSQRDRRVKNLVLTAEGLAAKERVLAQFATAMPWCYALDEAERHCFLTLLRRMLDTPRPQDRSGAAEQAGTAEAESTARSR